MVIIRGKSVFIPKPGSAAGLVLTAVQKIIGNYMGAVVLKKATHINRIEVVGKNIKLGGMNKAHSAAASAKKVNYLIAATIVKAQGKSFGIGQVKHPFYFFLIAFRNFNSGIGNIGRVV